jgi:hypothetical protein
VSGIQKLVDDILGEAPTFKELIVVMRNTLEAASKANISMSLAKVQCGRKVIFVGAVLSEFGASPDPKRVSAIAEMEALENIAELCQFIILWNQFYKWQPDSSHSTHNMRTLLFPGVVWDYLPNHETEFNQVKGNISNVILPQFYDSSLQTVIVNASKTRGFSWVLV